MGFIPATRAGEILSAQLRALPDLFDYALQTTDVVTQGILREQYTLGVAGNGAALTQQLVAAVDRGVVGWAPWQAAAVLDFAALPTPQLIAGQLVAAVAPALNTLLSASWDAVRDAIAVAVEEVLAPFIDLLGVIPVAGQVIDILLGVVMGIVEIVRLAKASQAAQSKEHTVPPVVPNPDKDAENAFQIVTHCERGDWSALWMPAADPLDTAADWRRGWGCELIAPGGPFAGGRRIGPVAKNAWMFDPAYDSRAFVLPAYAAGGVPGAKDGAPWRMHRYLQVSDGATDIVDTLGPKWAPMATSALLNAWSMLWAKSQAAWAVDTELVLTAWIRYAGALLEQLDSGELCSEMRPESRRKARRFFAGEVLGVEPDATPEQAIDAMPLRGSLLALRKRQLALAGTTAVAYVNTRECPPALRDELRSRQADFLQSNEVCRIDLNLITDPIYRAQLELARQNKGAQCYMATNIQAPLLGPDRWDPRAPVPEPPPASAVPTRPRAPRASSGPEPVPTVPGEGSEQGGSLLWLLVLGGLGLGAFVAARRWGSR